MPFVSISAPVRVCMCVRACLSLSLSVPDLTSALGAYACVGAVQA